MTDGGKINPSARELAILHELEKKVLWLASWTIHHANHLRENVDGVKVGGHQASSASLATIMTALYFRALRPQDRVAVKPHASPIFHAIQYLLGRQSRQKLEDFRGYKGAQSYPSRSKDADDVDFSTGSVGLGVAQTLFSSLVQDYVRAHGWGLQRPEGRMIALVFQGGAAWRKRLLDEIGDQGDVTRLIEARSDEELARLMTNLAGHDLPSLIEAFGKVDHDRPICFISYTIKGFGLPFAGHKDNHAGLMTPAQTESLRAAMHVRPGYEWDTFEGLSIAPAELQQFLDRVPYAQGARRHQATRIPVPAQLPVAIQPVMS